MRIFPLIVSSPSGGGKTTVVNAVLGRAPNIGRVITATSRAPRAGEKNGRDYHFWSDKQFQTAIKKGEMLEWAKVFVNYYGVPKKSVDGLLKKKIIPVMVIDVQGAASIKKIYPEAVSVFLMPPSMAELKRRILKRKDGTKDIAVRLKTAAKEIKQAAKFNYIIVNDDLNSTIDTLISVIKAEEVKNVKRKRT